MKAKLHGGPQDGELIELDMSIVKGKIYNTIHPWNNRVQPIDVEPCPFAEELVYKHKGAYTEDGMPIMEYING